MMTIEQMFESDEDFSKHVDNLWQTRAGLHKIIETRPDLKEVIAPQFHTLNELIARLIDKRPYHPRCGFS